MLEIWYFVELSSPCSEKMQTFFLMGLQHRRQQRKIAVRTGIQ